MLIIVYVFDISQMVKEGWIITMRKREHDDNNYVIKTMYGILIGGGKFNDDSWITALQNARNHGMICDDDGYISDIDVDVFNNNFYLWQAQELGIL